MRSLRFFAIVSVLATLAACKEKEAYHRPRGPLPGPARPAAGAIGPGAGSPSGPAVGPAAGASPAGTPAQPDAGTPPVETPPAGPRPLAIVVSAQGSLVLTIGASGRDVVARRVPGVVRVLPDGTARTLRVRTEPCPRKTRGKRESSFATLEFAGSGAPKDVLKSRTGARPDLAAAEEAEPDLAPEFFHHEKIVLAAARGPTTTWIASTEGFLGGAHPYATQALLVVDADTGGRPDLSAPFEGRDLVRETGLSESSRTCAWRLSGIGVAEGAGGVPVWLAGLGSDVESCQGRLLLKSVAAPAGEGAARAAGAARLGLDALGDLGLSRDQAIDARTSPSGGAAVLLLALGRDDVLEAPGAHAGGGEARTRELRAWVRGMERPAVVGRIPTLLTVQFLDDHPEPAKVLESLGKL